MIKLCAVAPASPWNIIAITFTNKAADEMKSRLSKMLGENDGSDIWAGTFHAACVRILRRDIERLGVSRSFTIYDSDDSKQVMQQCIRELNIDDKRFSPKDVLFYISRAKNALIKPEDYLNYYSSDDYRYRTVSRLYDLYQKKLKSASALDFDDIIMYAVALLSEYQDVREYYQNKFRYVLVDEYQDTNLAQYHLISILSEKWKNICVVGDDDQSIYRFRGATIENILNFEKEFKDARVIRLEQNYRSTQNILDAANEHGVAVVKDEGLAHMLGKLSVGDEIPQELYAVVAQILVFVSNIDRQYAKKTGQGPNP
jgi:DNA helicase-2/ATP-dependent DNA helicase PcrA